MARRPIREREPAEKEEEKDAKEVFPPASRLLDCVLNSLYDFGETLPNGSKKKKSKKKCSQEKLSVTANNNLLEDKSIHLGSSGAMPGKSKNVSSFFDSLKDELAYHSINKNKPATECSSSNTDTLQCAQKESTTEIEVVTFHGQHRKKKAKLETPEIDNSKEKETVQEKHPNSRPFNLEKARLEVHQLGITGFEKKEQRVLEQERAIMLGAKPPKKEYLNYKVLQEKIKHKKAAKKGESVMENKSDMLNKRKKKGHEGRNGRSKKKAKKNVLPMGQVGTFKNGTLILRSCDIKKIKSSKVIK